ncbi:MAG: Ig-like domain-containing protein [Deltaproteobacteria bacterium]|nr:Ig-like domain-containing protein [Deltaproteobacteria bacterium]
MKNGRFRQVSTVLTIAFLLAVAAPVLGASPAEAAQGTRAASAVPDYAAPDRFRARGVFEVFVTDGAAWTKAGEAAFDEFYRERRVAVPGGSPAGDRLRIRLVPKGGGASHIDLAQLDGRLPSAVKGSNDLEALGKLSRAEFDVVDVPDKGLELLFPANNAGGTLLLRARIEGKRIASTPFQFPMANLFRPMSERSSFYTYPLDSHRIGPRAAGRAMERQSLFFREFCRSGSGHPSAYAYGWVGNDDRFLYVRIDFSGDNTRDGDKDYAKVYVKTPSGLKEFKVSEAETVWGRPSFVYTDKVPWRHKVYDFAIPRKELGFPNGAPGRLPLALAFAAYGTLTPNMAVTATVPDNNAAGVALNSQVSADFNSNLSPPTVDNTSFTVVSTSDGAPVDGSRSVSAATATFTPTSPLATNTNYTATLTTAIMDEFGRSLSENYVWNFTTAAADNTVTLFFRDTPGIFGCAVVGKGGTWGDAAGSLGLLLVPAIMFFAAKAKRKWTRAGKVGRRFPTLFVALLAASLSLGSVTADAGQLGAPQSSAKQGQFTLGAGYFHLEEKWEPDRASDLVGTIRVDWATDKVKQNALFLKGAYGVSPRCEVTAKIGAADRGAPQGFEDSYALFGAIGAKGILYSTPKFSIGPILEFNFYGRNKDDIAFTQGASTWRGTAKIESSWEAVAGVAVQADVGKALLYAGPLFSWSKADVKYRITDGAQTLDVSNKYTTKSPFGGFAGIRAALPAGLILEVEGQFRDRFSAGGTVSYPF